MAFTAQGNVSNVDLGTFLKIYSSNGVYNNLSTASEIWKLFLKLRASPAGGREYKYSIRTGYGPAAVQSLPAGSEGDYPARQRSVIQEATAQYKDFGMTVSVPRNLLNKTGTDLLQYADPLTEELDAKSIVAARIMSAQVMGDGTGAIGRTAAIPTVSGGKLVVSLSTASADAGVSHVGWFEADDRVKFVSPDASAGRTSGASGIEFEVDSVDVENDTITLRSYTSASSTTAVTETGAGDIAAGDYIYRRGTTANDQTDLTGNDYNAASETLTGLESLAAEDGRKVNGIIHSGTVSGSWYDAGGAPIDSSDFQKVLSKAKRRTGKGRYRYNKAFMFDTVYDALVESRETDRRFQTVEDGKRGVKMLGYQHQADFVEFISDEFVQKKRIWILPESREVLEFHGKDFESVEANKGQKFHLANGSTNTSQHARTMLCYMEGMGVAVCRHPAAIAAIKDFTA